MKLLRAAVEADIEIMAYCANALAAADRPEEADLLFTRVIASQAVLNVVLGQATTPAPTEGD